MNGLNFFRMVVTTLSFTLICGSMQTYAMADPPGGLTGKIFDDCNENWLSQNWAAVAIGCNSSASDFAAFTDRLAGQLAVAKAEAGQSDTSPQLSDNMDAVLFGTKPADTDTAVYAAFAIARSAFAYEKLGQHEKAESQRARAVQLLAISKPSPYTRQNMIDFAISFAKVLRSDSFYKVSSTLD